MAYLVLALLLVAVVLWYVRTQAGRTGQPGVTGAGQEVQRAMRRLGFRAAADRHPAESITDARLAAMGVVAAVAEMDGPLTRDELDQMVVEAQVTFGSDRAESEAIVTFGRWIAGRYSTPHEAARRLARIVARLAGDAAAPDLLRMAEAAAAHRGPPDANAEAALEAVRRAFRVKV